jgi:hypothetical protein
MLAQGHAYFENDAAAIADADRLCHIPAQTRRIAPYHIAPIVGFELVEEGDTFLRWGEVVKRKRLPIGVVIDLHEY